VSIFEGYHILGLLQIDSGIHNTMMRVILVFAILILISPVSWAARRPDITIDMTADVFSVDAKTNRISAKGHVVVTQGKLVVKGDRAVYDKAKEKVSLTGNIALTQGDTVLTCEMVDVYGVQNRVIASGNVTVISGDIIGKSGQAEYRLTPDHVYLWKGAEVRNLEDLAVGDRVFIDIKNKFIRATGSGRLVLSKQSLQKKRNSVQ